MYRSALTRPWFGYFCALALTGLVSGVIALIREVADVGNISMLYLLAVMASAVLFGRGPAILASVASFLAFNFFFVEPHYTLSVTSNDEVVALLLLLIAGIITGQLTALLRQRAREAQAREREAVVLYDVVRLMTDPELERALTAVAERIRTELELSAAVIVFGKESPIRVQADTGDSEAIALAREAVGPAEMVLGGGQAPTATQRGQPGRWIRVVPPTARTIARLRSDRVRSVPVNLKGQPVGSIILVPAPGARKFGPADDRLLSAVAHQLGLALERLSLQREATEAEVLRMTDELRTALLNAVSHDLRTPLSSIMASAGSLRQDDVSWTEEQRGEFYEAIETEAQRLNRLVGNLLDLSRIEAGSIHPEKAWYDLGFLINEVAGRLRTATAGHKLVIDVPDGLPPVLFDYVEIDQVISNLIENAVKYTPAGTEICVSARMADDEVEVDVADRGPGIPDAAIPRLFDAFYRASDSGQARGSGLGLAVAKGLVEAHAGTIRVENREGGGARFVFTLPLQGTESEPAAPKKETA
jgi:two-component system sensor histidine kinase KdpD